MALSDIQKAALAERLQAVQKRIAHACDACGRAPGDVRLLAVSKFHSTDAIRVAYQFGQREFGENYVQELVRKLRELEDLPDLRMRFVGHLQRNKVRDIVRSGCAIDTVDSQSLAKEISTRAVAAARIVDILVQVNVGREPQKAGVMPQDLSTLLDFISKLPAVHVMGLMTIPPARSAPEECRGDFRLLASLARDHGLKELSMGMSDDFEVAIQEGATMVRVGTAIFGPRPV